MRAVILADASFAARERVMLSRLEVGLADEGVRVIHALPERSARWHQGAVYTQPVTYKDDGLPLSLRWRVQKLVAELEELASPDPRVADVIHVFGDAAWDFGAELAAQTGAALALEVWAARLTRSAVRVRYGSDQAPAMCLAPTTGLESLLRDEDPGAPVRLAPWGVHTSGGERTILPEGRAWSALLMGSGRDAQAFTSALEGIAAASSSFPDLMIFSDSDAVMRSNLWPVVKRLGIVDRFTMIPDVEARRDPVLRADILICPESGGEYRSLMLDAMAAGMLIMAAADPVITTLIDQRTARLVPRHAPDDWHAAAGWALNHPDEARALASSARGYVKEHCRASAHIAAVMDVYEWLTTGEAIPFSAGRE